MKIAIDGMDYTGALDAARPLTIVRKLNERTECRFKLTTQTTGGLVIPARSQSVTITGESGIVCFMGRIVANPVAEYVGFGIEGPRYGFVVVALSDEALTLVPSQSTVHPLKETAEGFNPVHLALTSSVDRVPVNDVTVCGEHEAVAYVTEYFCGDGVTTSFHLGELPYFPSTNSSIIREEFDGREIDTSAWARTGDPNHLDLGGGGLALRGGSGIDGQTALGWMSPIEMRGTLLLEAIGVTLEAGSTGVIAGFFDGGSDSASCIAGFEVTVQPGTTSMSVQPLVRGVAVGTAITVHPGNQYTLRIRAHSPECIRALAVYTAASDAGAVTAGGEWKLSQGKLQFDVQEFVNGVGGMPVTLYEGAAASLPGMCIVVAASSINLVGSMRAFRLTDLGSGWVVSTPPGSGTYTRRMGTAVQAGECQLDRSGMVQFDSGSVPVTGEQIAVSYRTIGRAAGRAVHTESQQALTQAGVQAVAAWVGTVTDPAARCSEDCRNAAKVTAQTAAEDRSVLRGTYNGTNFDFSSDVQPGDALLLNVPSADLDSQVIVREVEVGYSVCVPDVVMYRVYFANDWAADLTIMRDDTVPDDVWLPVPIAPALLANVSGLSVTALNGNTVSINTGLTPPDGGGFEIRRRDFAFMAGDDSGLVTRSSLPNITFSRESPRDRFFVRMYDGATTPNYSEFSTALFINLPLGS